MKSKKKYVAPKIEMLLIVLENCFDNFISMYSCNKDKYTQPKECKVSGL
jgi:hypothetical protein